MNYYSMDSERPPTQWNVVASLNMKPFTQIDDLCWELEKLCAAHNLQMTAFDNVEITTNNNQMFIYDVVEKFKLETQSFTDHVLLVVAETDSGKYSAPRFMKNLRNAIKMLQSGEVLTVDCDCPKCDYCTIEEEK